MNFLPKAIDLSEQWKNLQSTVGCLISGQNVSIREEWSEKYIDVYFYCVRQVDHSGAELYQNLIDYLDKYCKDLREQLLGYTDENQFLVKYYDLFKAYSGSIEKLNLLFSYLNNHVVVKNKYSSVHINYAKYGLEHREQPKDVGEMAVEIWERELVWGLKETLVPLLIKEINRDRRGETVNVEAVKNIIASFVKTSNLKSKNPMMLYEEVFEVPFLKDTVAFFKADAAQMRETLTIPQYMDKVITKMDEEVERSKKFIHEASYTRVKNICREYLVKSSSQLLLSSCPDQLKRDDWNDLAHMFKLLNQIEGGIDALLKAFEKHLEELAVSMIKMLQEEETPSAYVKLMFDYVEKYKLHIKQDFGEKKPFVTAFDKNCVTIFNCPELSKTKCKSAEMLAKYCDEFMRKMAPTLSEAETDEKVNQIFTLFGYIEEKDLFHRFYCRNLARRLLLDTSQLVDVESAIIERLKQCCGNDYTSKLHQMITDITLSKDLNAKFSEYLALDEQRQLAHGFHVNVLQAGAWPVSQVKLPTFNIPQQLEKCYQMFDTYYKSQYNGRRLIVLHHMSQAEVRFEFCSKPYLVSMEVYTMGVLVLFNDSDVRTFQEIQEMTKLPMEVLQRHLQLLVNGQVLKTEDSTMNDSSSFTLNLEYTNKRTKLKLLPMAQAEVSQELNVIQKAVVEDRRMFLQAVIVRIMKANKRLSHHSLTQEVINQSKNRFIPSSNLIKLCIETLLEKKYMERDKWSSDTYEYVA